MPKPNYKTYALFRGKAEEGLNLNANNFSPNF